MTIKRKRKTTSIINNTLKDKAEFIILVGSETGTTIRFATAFKNELIKANKAVFITELNRYSSYKTPRILLFLRLLTAMVMRQQMLKTSLN